MANSTNRSADGAPAASARVPRFSAGARGVVAGLAVGATLLALGVGMLSRRIPSSGDVSPAADSRGPTEAHKADVTSPSTATETTLPADVRNGDVEYNVESGMIEPQRMAPETTSPTGDGGEPTVPHGVPTAVPARGIDDAGEPGLPREPDATTPSGTEQAPPPQLPRI